MNLLRSNGTGDLMFKNKFLLVGLGIAIGLVISGIGTYAATSYAISSNKVSYTDNSGLGVDNVQAAIDGTCSNIDTRLDSINSEYAQSSTGVSCASGEGCVIKNISGLNSSSVYLVTAWVRVQHNLARVITAGISDDAGRELSATQTAGSIDGNIYPRVTVSAIATGTTSIKISGSQNSGAAATIDTRYSIIKLK